MPLPKTVWTELWNRAINREPYGVLIRTDNPEAVKYALAQARPRDIPGYSICSTTDPTILIIAGPRVEVQRPVNERAMRMVQNDILPDDNSEPLP